MRIRNESSARENAFVALTRFAAIRTPAGAQDTYIHAADGDGSAVTATAHADGGKAAGVPERHHVEVHIPAVRSGTWDEELVGALAQAFARIEQLEDAERHVAEVVESYRSKRVIFAPLLKQ
jgi:hypothetical protein